MVCAFAASCLHAQIPVPNPPPPPPPPGSAQAAAQNEQSKHLKSIVDLVVLHATVVDSKGQFVPGLTQDNFHVYEDKVEQKIVCANAVIRKRRGGAGGRVHTQWRSIDK